MKAIETDYKGYKFRSRLEVRWAVFFDRLKINYQYDPETFNLNGLWYLPDFLLPDLFNVPVYVEVKPDINDNPDSWETVCNHEDFGTKWHEFTKEKSLLVLFGSPSDTFFHIINAQGHTTFNFSSICKHRQVFLNAITYSKTRIKF